MAQASRPEDQGRSMLRVAGDFVAKLLVSGGLLYWLIAQSDLATFGSILQHTNVGLFLLAAGLFVFSNALGAIQWFLLLRGQALAVSLRQAVVLYWVGVFFNNVLLGNIGGDAIRIFDMRRLTGETSRAAAATFMDRFVGLFSTCCLALGACVVVVEVRRPGLLSILIPVWLALVALLAMGLSQRLGALVQRVLQRLLPVRVSQILEELRLNIVVYRHKAPLLLVIWFVSLGVQFSRILVYWTAGAAVGLEVGLRYFIGFQPVAAIVAAVPISVGGLGVREGVLVELFGAVGVEESLAFAMSILGYAAGILASLLGGIAFIVRRIQPGQQT
jgi:glycosyltransferase 2 family protein